MFLYNGAPCRPMMTVNLAEEPDFHLPRPRVIRRGLMRTRYLILISFTSFCCFSFASTSNTCGCERRPTVHKRLLRRSKLDPTRSELCCLIVAVLCIFLTATHLCHVLSNRVVQCPGLLARSDPHLHHQLTRYHLVVEWSDIFYDHFCWASFHLVLLVLLFAVSSIGT